MKKRSPWFYLFFGAILLLIGVFFVPYQLEWGPEKNIYSATYAPIWMTINRHVEVNGFHPLYVLQFQKLLSELIVFVIFFVMTYMYLSGRSRE